MLSRLVHVFVIYLQLQNYIFQPAFKVTVVTFRRTAAVGGTKQIFTTQFDAARRKKLYIRYKSTNFKLAKATLCCSPLRFGLSCLL